MTEILGIIVGAVRLITEVVARRPAALAAAAFAAVPVVIATM